MQIVIDIPDDEVFKGYYTQKDGINEYHSMKSEYTVIQPKTVCEHPDKCHECEKILTCTYYKENK